jgi:mannose-6-phosphate isomerase-like protein (cupin superfamily)
MLRLMPFKFDVRPLVEELEAAPELWDDFDLRTNHPQSPHREMSDIIVRYNARENFTGDRAAFNEEHEAVWWDAAKRLPSVFPIVFDLMRAAQGERLGMVLITKQPPGATCYPHVDNGWHARHYEKFAVQLASNSGQSFHVEDKSLVTNPGDCFWFDNSRPHWVLNPTDETRMTMIVCIRTRFTERRA